MPITVTNKGNTTIHLYIMFLFGFQIKVIFLLL